MEAHRGGKGGWRQKGASRRRAESLIWMDLEMTGLDPESDSILEIACVVTDAHLETTLLGPNLAIYQPEEVLAGMNAWCVEHHGRSGLTERCRTSVVSLEEAEAQVLEFVEAHTPAGKIPLCGNTIHCDLAFLKRHMPRLVKHFHYQVVDVSSIKVLCRRWFPHRAREAPKKKLAHTAMSDVLESIEELRFYKHNFFGPAAPRGGSSHEP